MNGAWHVLLLGGIGVAAGTAFVNLLYLLRLMLDAFVAGELEQPHVWPDERSVTVWTGTDWFTATVMPVAFGRWGVAVCRDEAPRRAARSGRTGANGAGSSGASAPARGRHPERSTRA